MKKEVWIAIAVGIVVVAIFVFQNNLLSLGIGDQNNAEVNMDETKGNTSSGTLEVQDIQVGTGDEATKGKTVVVHYTGTFENGQKFDSSKDRGEPFEFTLGQGMVIEGWDLGVVGMKEGGVRRLTIPASLGYGPNDYGPIPGNSTLYFEIELIDVK